METSYNIGRVLTQDELDTVAEYYNWSRVEQDKYGNIDRFGIMVMRNQIKEALDIEEYELVRCDEKAEDVMLPNVFAKNENDALELFARCVGDGADGTKEWFFNSFCAAKCGEE